MQYCKMEDLPESLITVLKENEEEFDEDGIRNNMPFLGANNKNSPVQLINSMRADQIDRLVTVSEKKLCERFNYKMLETQKIKKVTHGDFLFVQ